MNAQKRTVLFGITALIAAIGFITACGGGGGGPGLIPGTEPNPIPIAADAVISIAGIAGVTPPVKGANPVTSIPSNGEYYAASITWSSAVPSGYGAFVGGTVYTATINLTANAGYTFSGVGADFFDVAGATTVSNTANSGVVTAVFPVTDPLVLGDTGPGGGIIFYYDAAPQTMDGYGTFHYLEAAPNDMPTTLIWQSSYTDTQGTEQAIGSGRKNTAFLVSHADSTPAAKACADYMGGGFDDWFLPSKDELNELYEWWNTDGKQLKYNLITGDYWSSSEFGSLGAFGQDFNDGLQGSRGKNDPFNVRAVRAF